MQTQLLAELRDTPVGREANEILRSCVHCGFCTATCPTYQLLGDELDGPRGRIYQVKELLEGQTPTLITLSHLDRCLTCQSCETTCPSGVRYARLIDLGREFLEPKLRRNGQGIWLSSETTLALATLLRATLVPTPNESQAQEQQAQHGRSRYSGRIGGQDDFAEGDISLCAFGIIAEEQIVRQLIGDAWLGIITEISSQ